MKTFLFLFTSLFIFLSCKKEKEDETIPKTTKTNYYIWAAGATAAGHGLIVHSSDGGKNWLQLSDSIELPVNLLDICIIDKNNLIAVGKPANSQYAGVYVSNNGGKNWQLSGSGMLPVVVFQAVYKYDNQNIYITGDSGNIYKTTNQGSTWTKIPMANNYKSYYFLRINATANDEIWVAGLHNFPADTTPILLHSSDGGNNWTRKDPISDLQITAAMYDQGHYLGIKTFKNSIWALGGFGQFVVKSTDNGTTWQNVTPAGGTNDANDIFLFSENEAMLLTDYGGIYYTTNGGTNWTKQTANTINWLLGIDATDDNKIWISGNAGGADDYTHIFYSDNKGQTWQDQTPQIFMVNSKNNLSKIRTLKVISEE